MAITSSAKKAAKQALKRRVFNVRVNRALKTSIKEVLALMQTKDKKGALAILPKVYKSIDKAVKKGLIKKNNGSRKKSRITKAIDKIEK